SSASRRRAGIGGFRPVSLPSEFGPFASGHIASKRRLVSHAHQRQVEQCAQMQHIPLRIDGVKDVDETSSKRPIIWFFHDKWKSLRRRRAQMFGLITARANPTDRVEICRRGKEVIDPAIKYAADQRAAHVNAASTIDEVETRAVGLTPT